MWHARMYASHVFLTQIAYFFGQAEPVGPATTGLWVKIWVGKAPFAFNLLAVVLRFKLRMARNFPRTQVFKCAFS